MEQIEAQPGLLTDHAISVATLVAGKRPPNVAFHEFVLISSDVQIWMCRWVNRIV